MSISLRQAIFQTAAFIESNPNRYDWFRGFVSNDRKPGDCGSPLCALGWLAVHAKRNDLSIACRISNELLKITDTEFYNRMDSLCPSRVPYGSWATIESWRRIPADCAATLRAYANRYHPAEPSKALVRYSGQELALNILRGEIKIPVEA